MIRHTRRLLTILTGTLMLLSLAATRDSLSAEDKAAANAEKTVKVEIKDITLNVPESWNQEEPAEFLKKFRLAQFKIDPVEGDEEPAELVVSVSGGGIDPNLKRWVGQFASNGRTAKIVAGDSAQGKYHVANLSGTYNKPVGPPIAGKTSPTPGYRMIGVILQVPDSNPYFLKLTGPDKTVASVEEALRKSFGGDAEKEEEYEIK